MRKLVRRNSPTSLKLRRTSAFTLVEILAVTLLIAGLLGMAALGISKNVKRGKINTAKAQISNFGSAISLFELECGFYPTALEDLISNGSGQKCKNFPKGGFLDDKVKNIPQDPWSEDYSYRKPGSHNTSSYDLWSFGPDKEDGTDDDVGNWDAEDSNASGDSE